ncbi:MAG: hypothetical protein J6Y47_07295 [Bacteroidales bacterium]|nr:hypothetical protein [Bacteroidales bacterium]
MNKQPEDVIKQQQNAAASTPRPANNDEEEDIIQEEDNSKPQAEQASLNIDMPPVTETDVEMSSSENEETDDVLTMNTDINLDNENEDNKSSNEDAKDDDIIGKINEFIGELDDKYYPVGCYLKESEIIVNKEQITIPVNSNFLYNQVEEVMSVIQKKLKEFYGLDFKIEIPIQQAQDEHINIDWTNPDEVYRWMVQNNSKINDFKIALNLNIQY